MADPNPHFRSAVPSGAGAQSEQGNVPEQGVNTLRAFGELPKTALQLLPSMPAISSTDSRDEISHEGLRADKCYVQMPTVAGAYELDEVEVDAILGTPEWVAALTQNGMHHAAGLVFCLLGETEILKMGEKWNGKHVQGLRSVKALQASKRDTFLKDLEALQPAIPKPELGENATDADKHAALTEWEERVATAHASRMINAIYMFAEAQGSGKPAISDFLYAVRGAEDLDFILEAMAEMAREHEVDPKGAPVLGNSWRQVTTLLHRFNQLMDMLGPDYQGDKIGTNKEIVDTAGRVNSALRSVLRHSVRKAHHPCQPDLKWKIGEEDDLLESAEAFVGLRTLEKLRHDLRGEEEELRRLEDREATANMRVPRRGGRARTALGWMEDDEDDVHAALPYEDRNVGGLRLSAAENSKLATALQMNEFKDWVLPADLVIIARATHSHVGRCPSTLTTLPEKMTGARGANSVVIDKASTLRKTLVGQEEIWDIPLGSMLKIVHGLISPYKRGFNLLTLAMATSKNRTDPSGQPDGLSVWFKREQLNMSALVSMFYMLLRLIDHDLILRVFLSAEDVHHMRRKVEEIHYHYGEALPPTRIFIMLEKTLSEHIEEVPGLAERRLQDRVEETSYPSITVRMDRLEQDNEPVFKNGISLRAGQLARETALQARSAAPVRTAPEWLGRLPPSAEAAEKKRASGQENCGGGKRSRGNDRAPLADATNSHPRGGVTCYACLGPHRSDDPGCPSKPGSGKAWTMEGLANLPVGLQRQITSWRSKADVLARYGLAPSTQPASGGLLARGQGA